MLLNTSDLENWLSDPEDWVHAEDKENDQWEYEIRVKNLTYRIEVDLIVYSGLL